MAFRFLQNNPDAAALPLAPRLGEVCDTLRKTGLLVLRADPGSGKSTLVPPALLETVPGAIVMLEPRRAAVLGIASRVAGLLGEEVGKTCGYSVRGERRTGPATRLEIVTEGLLVRRLQNDPSLAGVSTIIFDEFHERSIHADLAFALVMDLRRLGAKVNVLIMSATMDTSGIAARIAEIEGAAVPVIECPGRNYPVAVSYKPLPGKAYLGIECAQALLSFPDSFHDANARDVLVFLPGRREIADAASALRSGPLAQNRDVFCLHGSLPLAEQKKIIAGKPGAVKSGAAKPRIILSTNIAETGLTIPGVGMVVDTGLARVQRFHIPSGMNRLSLERISAQSAEQRAGRAGRTGPGVCVRLWPPGEDLRRETDAEIRRIDISQAVLECLVWGVSRPGGLPWLEEPGAAAWEQAQELLADMGAAEKAAAGEYRVTATGREIAALGVDVRPGRLCVEGLRRGVPALACAAAALLSVRDPGGGPDFRLRLEAFRREPNRNAQAAEMTEDLLQRLCHSRTGSGNLTWTAADEAAVGGLVGAAFPDRIARRQDHGAYRFVSGREGRLDESLAGAEWVAAAEIDAGERIGSIRLAAPLDTADALALLANRTTEESRIEWDGLCPRRITTKAAGRIVLAERRDLPAREEAAAALPVLLAERGLAILPWDDTLSRIRFFVNHADNNTEEAAWSDGTLAAEAAEWLGPFVPAVIGKGPIIDGQALRAALLHRFGYDKDVDRLVPAFIVTPKGRRRRVDYSSGEPFVSMRLQDAWELCRHNGEALSVLSVPVVFELLSPADRPIQVTKDLAAFWKGSYAEVRKEMKGRYPKHFWPEVPQQT